MKHLVTISAMALIISSSVFGEGGVPSIGKASVRDSVSFNTLAGNRGVSLCISKNETGNSIVEIYDGNRSLILTDKVGNKPVIRRNYVLGDEGTYFFVVESRHQRLEKKVTVAYTTNQTVIVAD